MAATTKRKTRALTGDELPPEQIGVAATIRAVSARVRAPERLRARLHGPRRRWPTVARVLGALALLAVGAVHLQQYDKLYSGVPTIGTLFVLNFIGATAIGLALLAPIERIANVLVTLAALAGIGQAATAFVFLWISERTGLFGFKEPGYDPPAIATARAAEIATVVLLGVYVLARASNHRRASS